MDIRARVLGELQSRRLSPLQKPLGAQRDHLRGAARRPSTSGKRQTRIFVIWDADFFQVFIEIVDLLLSKTYNCTLYEDALHDCVNGTYLVLFVQ